MIVMDTTQARSPGTVGPVIILVSIVQRDPYLLGGNRGQAR